MINKIHELESRIRELEGKLETFRYSTQRVVESSIKKNWTIDLQSETFYGARLALCVDTRDPLGQGRVRFYSPALHDPNMPIKALPFAKPIANFGGFDDSGNFSVPPAGSTLVLIFENGDRDSPFYLGTTWTRDRGAPPHNWNYPVQEFYKYHEGHRDGYLVGANDGSQTLPPWNTEAYNIRDYDSVQDFEDDPNAVKKLTVPYISGIKTAQKHRLKFVDGQYDCGFRFKRLELGSGDGNWLMMKDDHLHPCGQEAHPLCGCAGGSGTNPDCVDEDGNPTESTSCGEYNVNTGSCGNPLFKRQEECAPYGGPGTPQGNRCMLEQSGIQMQSRSGQMLLMDDSVVEPQGNIGWERATEPFNYGCQNTFQGKIMLMSSTGHYIQLDDNEEEPELRSSENGIKMRTGAGHSFRMIDHTIDGNTAGEARAITIQSTSTHLLEMNDGDNEQASSPRVGDGEPAPKAKSAFVVLRSGYGLQFLMRDDSSQKETQDQYIELMAPMKDNEEFGPHLFRMQEAASGPGIVYLRAGGVFLGQSVDDWIETVGTDDNSPKVKVTQVKGHYLIDTEDLYYTHNDLSINFSERYTIFAARRDCLDKFGNHVPCLYPVIVGKDPIRCPLTGILHFAERSMSQYVFGSSGKPGDCLCSE